MTIKSKKKYPYIARCDICQTKIISYCGFENDGFLLRDSFKHPEIKHICDKCGDSINKNFKKFHSDRKNRTIRKLKSAIHNHIDLLINKNTNEKFIDVFKGIIK